jgi:multidrug efflux system membrane fusion protein
MNGLAGDALPEVVHKVNDGMNVINNRYWMVQAIWLGFLGSLLAACNQPTADSAAPPPPTVAVSRPVQREIAEWDEYTGRFEAVETVEVRARVGGYLEKVNFKDGSLIKKGDLLFVIDPRPYKAALGRAQGELARAQARRDLAKNELARAQRLFEKRVLSEEEFDTRDKNLREADAAVQAARSAVDEAKLDLEFTEVRAPISGRIGRELVTEGNLVNDGTGTATLLTTIVSVDPIYVYFEVDEQAYLRQGARRRTGGRSTLQGAENPVFVGLADEEGFPHEGRLDFLDNRFDPAVGTIRARAVVDNPDGLLTPGLFARVKLPRSGKFPAVLVDDKAVLTDQDRKYVYVLDADNRAQRRDVRLGRMAEGLRIVTDGLSADDAVVVYGVQKIFFPGMAVIPQFIDMGAPPPPPPGPKLNAGDAQPPADRTREPNA